MRWFSQLLGDAGFVHGFSTRKGGVSSPPFASLNLGSRVGDAPEAVEENRRRLHEAAGLPAGSIRTCRQVHGPRVLDASGPHWREEEADALLGAGGVAVGVFTADCVPVLLADPVSGEVVAVHAGWRGTVAEIAKEAVRALEQRGRAAEGLLAAIGPAIARCCYEVSPELAATFRERYGAAEGRKVDLVAANRSILLAAGLRPERIDVLDTCTFCNREEFFSHRRDGGRTGRHLSFIVSRPLS